MSLYSYVCAYCHTYRRVVEHPLCPCREHDIRSEAHFQLGIFKPYTETNGKGKPAFETKQQRDTWLKANRMTYDNNSRPGPVHKPLIDAKLEHEIMTRAASGEPVKLDTISPKELRKGRSVEI